MALQLTTPSETTLVLTRTFAAPREHVWEAMLSPHLMRRWTLPPPGWRLTGCACDPRVGGALNLTFEGEATGPAMTIRGEFSEVVRPERAVHSETMSFGADPVGSLVEQHEFHEEGGVTTLRITQTYPSTAARDEALVGMESCMEAGYAQLDVLLAAGG